jgi:very-short-patch-repair endonuclease
VRVAVEVDGGAHEAEERQAYDLRRDAVLERAGIKVLRVPMQALLGSRIGSWRGSCPAARPRQL